MLSVTMAKRASAARPDTMTFHISSAMENQIVLPEYEFELKARSDRQTNLGFEQGKRKWRILWCSSKTDWC